jgi:hypothetical protein
MITRVIGSSKRLNGRAWLAPLGLALAVGLAAPTARAVEYSYDFQEKIAPATEALHAKAWASAIAKSKEALAVAKGNAEKSLALKIIMQSGLQGGDMAAAESGAEQLQQIDLSPADKLQVQQALQYVYLTQRHYDRALPITKQIIAATGGQTHDFEMLFAEYQALRDCPNGLQALEKSAKGRKLKQDEAQWQWRCYYDAKDTKRASDALEAYNANFQNKDMYAQLVLMYRNGNPPLDDLATLNLYRLGAQHEFVNTKDLVLDYAQRALDSGASNEADRVLSKAVERKTLVVDDKSKKLVAEAKRDAADDKKNLEQNDRESKAGKNGDKDFQVATAYFSAGDYPSAIDAAKRALSADHVARVKRVDQANMLLGMALARQKKYDEAEKAFLAAKADPRMAKAATLWLAWLRS